VTVGPDGQIYVTNCSCGQAVFRVDPATGNQFPVTSGDLLVVPTGIVAAPTGDLYVSDAEAFGGAGGVIRVNPGTGQQTEVASGGFFFDPLAIAIGPTGDLFVADVGDGVTNGSIVVRVDPATGNQTLVASAADFADFWIGITVAPNGDIYVLSAGCGCTVVVHVDPTTGDQTPVTGDGLFEGPTGIAYGGGVLFLSEPGFFGPPAVIRVDPSNGNQYYVTAGVNPGDFAYPAALAIVPGFPLTVTLAGAGTGTVTSAPVGIACPGDCTETYAAGTPVTLTAQPTGSSVFVGWSGACTGQGPCLLSMVAAQAVTATFAPPSFVLTVTRAGAGSGTVTSDVAGIACPPDCAEAYSDGTAVTLTPLAAPGSVFVSWSGACAGAAPCVVQMLADRAVTATFERQRGIVTGPASGAGQVRHFGPGGPPAVAAFDAYPALFAGGVFVATGDLDAAGSLEIVTGAGATGAPHVQAFDIDGTPRSTSFLAYAPAFLGGVRVAACDFDGDGRAEIVTASGAGGVAQVRVIKLDGSGNPASDLASFTAYDAQYLGGAFVACGDVDGDGTPDVVTGTDVGGGPHVRIFSLAGGLHEVVGFFPFGPGFLGGVRVAAGDVDGSGRASVIAAAGPGGAPHVRVLKWTGVGLEELASFLAYDAVFPSGVFVGAGDVTGDGHADVITGPGVGGAPHVRVFTGTGVDTGIGFLADSATFTGGVTVAAGP
jgi:hypothetical protein